MGLPQQTGMATGVTSPPTPGARNAFTLIEVLVVIAIIALLAAMLLPALARAKGRSQAVVCSNGLKQLATAHALYADENDELFVNNHGTQETLRTGQSWVNNIQDWLDSDGNTN